MAKWLRVYAGPLFRILGCNILPYSGKFSRGRNFREAEIFAIFRDQTPAPKNFLLTTSRAQYLRAADQVNKKLTHFVVEASANCGSLSQPTVNSPQLRIDLSSLPLAWQFFAVSNRHTLVSVEILLSFENTRCGSPFPSGKL